MTEIKRVTYYEREYQKAKKRKEHLIEKKKSYTQGILFGIVLFGIGIWFLWYVLLVENLMIANMLYGPACMVAGYKIIKRGIINCGSRWTESMAERSKIYTLSMEIEDTTQKMGELLRKIETVRKQELAEYDRLMGGKESKTKEYEEMAWLYEGSSIQKNWEDAVDHNFVDAKYYENDWREEYSEDSDEDLAEDENRTKKKGVIRKLLLALVAVIAVAIAYREFGTLIKARNGKIENGIYRVTNLSQYPDAFISVQGNSLQFHNIDLNALYEKYDLDPRYLNMEDDRMAAFDEQDAANMADLNSFFVDAPWTLDYEKISRGRDTNYVYTYFFQIEQYRYGIVIRYDALRGGLILRNGDRENQMYFKYGK